jgi:glycosyltransferase involved in cell wall biosynthesis
VYFPRVNGVSTSIRTFRTDLESQGVETVLVVPEYPGQQPDTEAGIVRVASGGVPKDPEDRRFKLGALRKALAGLKEQEFDLVHVQTPFIAHYAGRRFARERGIPLIATYHTFFEEYLHHYVPMLPRSWGRALARHYTRSQCADVDSLVVPSAPMRDLLAAYDVKTHMEVLPTGLPKSCFTVGDGPRFRAVHGIPQNRPLLLYVGRVAFEKNIPFLLEMFAHVRKSRPDALLVIAGEGPARASLQQQAASLGIAEDTVFVGYLERTQGLPDCYAAADAFVFASRTETQGLVLLEAMAQSRPVVSTAVLGTASILKPNCGAIIVKEELAEFSAAAVKLLGDPALARSMGKQAREYALSWSSARMAGRLVELYSQVAARRQTQAAQLR